MAHVRTFAALCFLVIFLSATVSSQNATDTRWSLYGGTFPGSNNMVERGGLYGRLSYGYLPNFITGGENSTQNNGPILLNLFRSIFDKLFTWSKENNAMGKLFRLFSTLSNSTNTSQEKGLLGVLYSLTRSSNGNRSNRLSDVINVLRTLSTISSTNPRNRTCDVDDFAGYLSTLLTTSQENGISRLLNTFSSQQGRSQLHQTRDIMELLVTLSTLSSNDHSNGTSAIFEFLTALYTLSGTTQGNGTTDIFDLLTTLYTSQGNGTTDIFDLLNLFSTVPGMNRGNITNDTLVFLKTLLNISGTDMTGLLNQISTLFGTSQSNITSVIGALLNRISTLSGTTQDNSTCDIVGFLNTLSVLSGIPQSNSMRDLIGLLNIFKSVSSTSLSDVISDIIRYIVTLANPSEDVEDGEVVSALSSIAALLPQTNGNNDTSPPVASPLVAPEEFDIDFLQSLLTPEVLSQITSYITDLANNSSTTGSSTFDTLSLLVGGVMPYAQQYIENYIDSMFREGGVGETCRTDMGIWMQGLMGQQMWAMQMIDAFGKPGSDILIGQYKWLGSYDECVKVKAVTYSNVTIKSDPVEQFTGKYCRAEVPVGTPELPIKAMEGLCVPSSCSADDIMAISDTVQKALMNGSVAISPQLTCIEDKQIETDLIVVMCILAILGLLIVIGTLYDVISVQMKSNEKEQSKPVLASDTAATDLNTHISAALTNDFQGQFTSHNSIGLSSNMSKAYTNGGYSVSEIADEKMEGASEKSKLDELKHDDVHVNIGNKTNAEAPKQTQNKNERGTLERVLLAFSAYSNGVKILSTEQGAGSLGAINGVRFLSMCWVILGHTYSFAFGYDANLPLYIFQRMDDWSFTAIVYASVSVDSFFAISGILVAYLLLRELKKAGGAKKINWFMFYFHRFWRLTPPYMLVLMVGTVVLPYVYSGPFWSSEFSSMEFCRESWWTNLLYINNYVNTDKLCLGWSWYLANDMQFYIISPLILLPLFYNLIAGGVSCLVFLAATIITTALVNSYHEYPAQNISPYAPLPKDVDYFKNIYLPSYTRMGPYIVGLFTGYVLYRCKCKFNIPKVVNLACWVLCIGLCTVVVYGLYSEGDSHIFSTAESNAFTALHRTGWGIAVCWIVFACATGHGGWINELLSWKAFIPLSRLTYCAYLIHPLVMILFHSNRRQPTIFTDYESIYLFLGHLVISYGGAFIVSLAFESPMMGLEKAIFGKRKKH